MKELRVLFAGISAIIIMLGGGLVYQSARVGQYKRCMGIMESQNEMLAGKVESLEQENRVLVETPRETKVIYESAPEFEPTDAEIELMAKIVHCEAGNQDMIGKRLVADCILNRVDDERFPNTIEGVIYQDNQFAVGNAGTFDESDINAVLEECKERIDTEVLWFRTGGYHSCGEPLYPHGAHFFSGYKDKE